MATVYSRPFPAFRFQVAFEIAGQKEVVASFSQFSGVNMTMETIESRAGSDGRGVRQIIPVMTRFEPVTLSKGVIGDNAFLDWLFSAMAGPEVGPRNGGTACRTLNVVALDDQGKAGVVWSLKNALPVGYSLSPMDGSSSEVLAESLTFAITGLERKVNPPAAQ